MILNALPPSVFVWCGSLPSHLQYPVSGIVLTSPALLGQPQVPSPYRVDDHSQRAQVHSAEKTGQGLHAGVSLLGEGRIHHQQTSKQSASLRRRENARDKSTTSAVSAKHTGTFGHVHSHHPFQKQKKKKTRRGRGYSPLPAIKQPYYLS